MATSGTARISSPPGRHTLLGLPAELRNAIWELVLVANGTIRISESRQGRFHTLPPLLRTNIQIRDETLSTFFGSNTFEFNFKVWSQSFAATEWIRVVGSNSALVMSLHLHIPCWDKGLVAVDMAARTVRHMNPLVAAKPWAMHRCMEEAEKFLGQREGNAIQSVDDMLDLLSLLCYFSRNYQVLCNGHLWWCNTTCGDFDCQSTRDWGATAAQRTPVKKAEIDTSWYRVTSDLVMLFGRP